MAKIYHCAVCGKELKVVAKAIPRKGIVMNLVEPHECKSIVEIDMQEAEEKVVGALVKNGAEEKDILDASTNEEAADKVAKAFESFPFVKKLNEGPEIEPLPLTDRRPKDQHREEVTSTAPTGLLNMAKGTLTPSPVEQGRELKEPNDE